MDSAVLLVMGLGAMLVNHSLLETLQLGAVVFASLVAMLLLKQNSLLYQPAPGGTSRFVKDNPKGCRSPAEYGLRHVAPRIVTADGVRLHAWLLLCTDAPARPVILYLHGNAGNVGHRLDLFSKFVTTLNVSVLALDYRGFGNSEGTPSEDGLVADARAALAWLRTQSQVVDTSQIFVLGTSLGGAVGLSFHALDGEHVRGLIVENSFTSVADMALHAFPVLRPLRRLLVKPILANEFASASKVRLVRVPVLFIVGAMDEVIPPEHSTALYEGALAARFRDLKVLPGGHNDLPYTCGPAYFKLIDGFMAQCSSNLYS